VAYEYWGGVATAEGVEVDWLVWDVGYMFVVEVDEGWVQGW
jgi:hypothetical protein